MIEHLINFGFVKTKDEFKSVDYSLSINFYRKLSTLYCTLLHDESSKDINMFIVKKKRVIFEFRHIDNRKNFSYSNLDRNAFEYYLGGDSV